MAKQNDGGHSAVQKKKNGNWGVGLVFLQVIVQFPSVVLHASCLLLNSSALPRESGLGHSGRCCRNKFTNSFLSSHKRDLPNNNVAAENQESV